LPSQRSSKVEGHRRALSLPPSIVTAAAMVVARAAMPSLHDAFFFLPFAKTASSPVIAQVATFQEFTVDEHWSPLYQTPAGRIEIFDGITQTAAGSLGNMNQKRRVAGTDECSSGEH
jgi:hypothetical protein